jgi:gluconolactonase
MTRIFTDGLGAPEGPVFLDDNSLMVVEMALDRGCVTHISADGSQKLMIAKTGGPNGQVVDRNGDIWVTETIVPSLVRVRFDGSSEVFLTGSTNTPFLFPNDVVVGPDRALYMTDSGILNKYFSPGGNVVPNYRELDFDGKIFRIETNTKSVVEIDRGLKFPNGIAFGPDRSLYVNETMTGMIYRYPWRDGRVIGLKEAFGNVFPIGDPQLITGPDGMKFGTDGNLYVATLGHGDISILNAQGDLVDRIKARGRLTTNLAFGPKGSRQIFITEVEYGCIEVFDVGVDGLEY